MKPPFLLVCGPRGVGKSSVGFQVFYEVMLSGIRAAYVDLDQVSFCRPIPEDDPDNHRVKVRNLARIWSVYQQAGARCLVATGDVDSRDVAAAYAAAVPGLALSTCHLDANTDTLRERFLARGRGEAAKLAGDDLLGATVEQLSLLADEAARSAKAPERELIGAVHIQTDGQTVRETVARVRTALGDWPQLN